MLPSYVCSALAPSRECVISSLNIKGLHYGPAFGGSVLRYISTRGEAPALGFCDVMLTGLARDGGLYVPETWPQLSHETIAGLFGRPYAEVAVEVITPVRRRRDFRRRSRRMANEAYATFRHPAVVPLDQIGAQPVRARTVPRPDAGLQGRRDAAAGAADGPCAGASAASAPPSWSRPRAIPAAPRSMRFAGRDNVDLFVLFPHGRISDVQRRMMTTAGAANVHALAIEGTFDDCQALVKAMFNHHGFRDAVSLSGVNSINWARIVAQMVYYFTVGGRARRARAHGRFHRADGKFRRHLRRLRRQADGPADRPAAHRHQCQRHPARARSRPASTKCARFTPRPRPRWTSRSRRISSGCCSRRAGATPTACAG